MPITYRISGQTYENSVAAPNLIIVYKADRDIEPSSIGEELGRAYADSNGIFEVTWEDWSKEVFVIGADPSVGIKYNAKIFDWVFGETAGYDPYYDYVVSLMHMEGANGGQAFVDENSENVILVTGQTNTSTVQAKYGGSAARFDGDRDWLTLEYRPGFNLGTQDWCLEMWVRLDDVTGYQTFWDSRSEQAGDSYCPVLFRSNSALLEMYVGNSNGTSWKGFNSAGTLVAGQWHHIAGTCDNGTYRMFLDGIEIDSFIEGTAVMTHNRDINIGCRNGYSSPLTGYIDDLRFTIGKPRYVTDFTPPTEQHYGNVDPFFSNVTVLMHMEGANDGQIFTDVKGNVCTAQNDAKTSNVVVKFGATSGRLDGNSDRVSIDYSPSFLLGQNDFTIEMWIYPLSLDGTSALISNRINDQYGQFYINVTSTGIVQTYFQKGTTQWMSSATTAGALQLNQWQHLAITRRTSDFKTFINGQQVSAFTDSAPVISPVLNNIYLGAEHNGNRAMNMYMDEFRFTVGSSRYNTNFTAPLRAFPDA